MVLNFRPSCLYLLSAGITSLHCHAWFMRLFGQNLGFHYQLSHILSCIQYAFFDILLYVCVCVSTCVMVLMCGGQRIAVGDSFRLLSYGSWELRSLSLVARAFTCWATLATSLAVLFAPLK